MHCCGFSHYGAPWTIICFGVDNMLFAFQAAIQGYLRVKLMGKDNYKLCFFILFCKRGIKAFKIYKEGMH